MKCRCEEMEHLAVEGLCSACRAKQSLTPQAEDVKLEYRAGTVSVNKQTIQKNSREILTKALHGNSPQAQPDEPIWKAKYKYLAKGTEVYLERIAELEAQIKMRDEAADDLEAKLTAAVNGETIYTDLFDRAREQLAKTEAERDAAKADSLKWQGNAAEYFRERERYKAALYIYATLPKPLCEIARKVLLQPVTSAPGAPDGE